MNETGTTLNPLEDLVDEIMFAAYRPRIDWTKTRKEYTEKLANLINREVMKALVG